jgi:hypothetical protein
MRVCDRCKKTENLIKTLLLDRKDGSEYDLCVECSNAFLTFLNPREKSAPELEIKAPQASPGRKKP